MEQDVEEEKICALEIAKWGHLRTRGGGTCHKTITPILIYRWRVWVAGTPGVPVCSSQFGPKSRTCSNIPAIEMGQNDRHLTWGGGEVSGSLPPGEVKGRWLEKISKKNNHWGSDRG